MHESYQLTTTNIYKKKSCALSFIGKWNNFLFLWFGDARCYFTPSKLLLGLKYSNYLVLALSSCTLCVTLGIPEHVALFRLHGSALSAARNYFFGDSMLLLSLFMWHFNPQRYLVWFWSKNVTLDGNYGSTLYTFSPTYLLYIYICEETYLLSSTITSLTPFSHFAPINNEEEGKQWFCLNQFVYLPKYINWLYLIITIRKSSDALKKKRKILHLTLLFSHLTRLSEACIYYNTV